MQHYLKDSLYRIDMAAVNKNYGNTKRNLLDSYILEINELIECGSTYKKIHKEISKKGYKGSESTLRGYMSEYRKLIYSYDCFNKEKITYKLINRSLIINLLYKPIEKIKKLDLENAFRELFISKDMNSFDNWLERARKLNINKINSFINGITRDIDAVKNAIRYKYNNGLAEGHVNKLKVIKRIMYGHNNFKLLRIKILYNK